MSPTQAKFTLARWRPDLPGPPEPDVVEALQCVASDTALREWWQAQQQFHRDVAAALRQPPVPATLANRILAARRRPQGILRFLPYRAAPWWAAAAAAVGVLAATVVLWPSAQPADQADFATFRSRMVRAALREYRMDVVTNDLALIRGFLSRNQAPAQFELSPSLAALPPVGGGLLSWQGQRVSMVCLDGRDLGMLYLFVVPTQSLVEGVPGQTTVEQVNRLSTASWTRGSLTYVLASSAPPSALRQLLGTG